MKKYILSAIAIIVIITSLLFADTIAFEKDGRPAAQNVQGRIKVWNGNNWEYAANEDVTVKLYYDADHGGHLFDTQTTTTNYVGNYGKSFEDRYHNYEYCDKVEVIFRGSSYISSYDGIEVVDIFWVQSH